MTCAAKFIADSSLRVSVVALYNAAELINWKGSSPLQAVLCRQIREEERNMATMMKCSG